MMCLRMRVERGHVRSATVPWAHHGDRVKILDREGLIMREGHLQALICPEGGESERPKA